MVYIVWNYDDGIIAAYDSVFDARQCIEDYHEKGFYHKEDMNIKEIEVQKHGEPTE